MSKIKFLFLFIIGVTVTMKMLAQQNKNLNSKMQSSSINEKMLIGSWYSEDDKKYVIVFKNSKYYIEYYDNKVVDTTFYKLSKSCNLSDTTKSLTLTNAYLLLGNSIRSLDQCNEVLNLNKNTLSYRNNETGKLHVFNRLFK